MLVKELKKIPLFKHFSRAALQTLSALVEVKDYDDKRVIFHAGTPRDRLYIVLVGRVVIEKEALGQ